MRLKYSSVRSHVVAPELANNVRATKLLPLPDYLQPGLQVVFVGFNPGERSARLGHYYAGAGNLFWRALSESGLVPEALGFCDDWRIAQFGNRVDRFSEAT